MGAFIFIFIALIIIQILSSGIKANSKRVFQTISCFIILWLIQGLRHESIGIDSATSYRPYFESVWSDFGSLFDFSDTYMNYEIGYIILNKVFKTLISSDTQLFILFTSFLSIAPIAYIFYKYSNNIVFSFWVFTSLQIYHFGFSGIRQAIAIAICFLSFHYIVQKKIPIFLALVLLASTFHTSAILFLPAYWVYHKFDLTPKRLIISLMGLLFVVFFVKSIAVEIVTFLFGGEKYVSALDSSGAPSYNLLILFFVVLFWTYMSDNYQLAKLRSFVLLAVAFQALGIISAYATRIGYYYYIFFPLVIPLAIDTSKRISNKGLVTAIICGLLCAFFFYVNGSGYLEVIPYKFFWE